MVKTRRTTGRSGQNRWGDSWPPVGRISGRPRGIPVAAYGENLMATHTQGTPPSWRVILWPSRRLALPPADHCCVGIGLVRSSSTDIAKAIASEKPAWRAMQRPGRSGRDAHGTWMQECRGVDRRVVCAPGLARELRSHLASSGHQSCTRLPRLLGNGAKPDSGDHWRRPRGADIALLSRRCPRAES
jgi:hypothetical protein